MKNMQTKNIIILGGGTAGWMTAASLSKFLSQKCINITVIESSLTPTVGVGEATLPGIREFNNHLGIDEIDFIKKTNATFKLGIKFTNWAQKNSSFFHPFSDYGAPIYGIPFHEYATKESLTNPKFKLENFCLATALAEKLKFAQPNGNNPLTNYNYAFHIDASLYAEYLKKIALKNGVQAIDTEIEHAKTNPENGEITALVSKNGSIYNAELFIDCSGFSGKLIQQTLKTGYDDWSEWLPCDSAIAVQSTLNPSPTTLTPYTESIAREAGWSWHIPLQNRKGNGYVYCSKFIETQRAIDDLLQSITGKPITEPRLLKFKTGRSKKFWNKNCVAVGLSGGFIEPLESTSIAMIQTAIGRIQQFFPFFGSMENSTNEANRQALIESERIRDFIILHYTASQRNDSEFWRHCKNISWPDTLAHKVSTYKETGYFVNYEHESFSNPSWHSIYYGFGIRPFSYDGRVDLTSNDNIRDFLGRIEKNIFAAANHATDHYEFMKKSSLTL